MGDLRAFRATITFSSFSVSLMSSTSPSTGVICAAKES
jgi:hypothetical protein